MNLQLLHQARDLKSEIMFLPAILFIFHAFDVGEDINLDNVKEKQLLARQTSIAIKIF